jgi:predicted membrane protein
MGDGFFYPNEFETQWSVLIVLYPFITGLVAGAFIVSSAYHVFGIASLKSVARFSLITALAFLLVAPLALQAHLGHPERALNIFLMPHFTSAMAGFGYIWAFYTLLVVAEVWLSYRKDFILLALSSTGLRKRIYTALTLGVLDLSEEAFRVDEKIVKVLALVGIPSAFLLHGYVGFIFGAIKANPWWSSPLVPVIFLMSAIVSGTALLIILYVAVMKIRRLPVDRECVNTMSLMLLGFLALDLALEGLELLQRFYEEEESWDTINALISHKLPFTYFGLQLGLGGVVSAGVLIYLTTAGHKLTHRMPMEVVVSLFVLAGVFAMRWNIVIGGQLFSKSLHGFLSYNPPLFGQEGVTTALAVLALPFAILGVFAYFTRPWLDTVLVPEGVPISHSRPSPGGSLGGASARVELGDDAT